MVSAGIAQSQDEGISLSDSNDYLRLSNIYQFHGIKSRFADMVLQSAKAEGRRLMMMRQPFHVRIMSTMDDEKMLSFSDCSVEPTVQP
tara:strand:+ start:7168 stop:7431 length:264 start_codon:yes stop_codon:yes gene_type:complete